MNLFPFEAISVQKNYKNITFGMKMLFAHCIMLYSM